MYEDGRPNPKLFFSCQSGTEERLSTTLFGGRTGGMIWMLFRMVMVPKIRSSLHWFRLADFESNQTCLFPKLTWLPQQILEAGN